MTERNDVTMSPTVYKLRWLALGSHIMLILWMCIWYFGLLSTSEYSLVFIFLMYVMPLMLPLWGIIKAKPYTHAWASFIVLLYLLHAITVIYAEPSQIVFAAIELVLASAMFVGCAGFARLRGQELGTGLKKLKDVMEDEKQYFER